MAKHDHLKILKQGVVVWNQWREDHREIDPDLSYTVLSNANLRNANLLRTDLRGANLRNANLRNANLSNANLSGADLQDANLAEAIIDQTWFSDNDLSKVKGLETVRPISPSYISIGTIYKSGGQGQIPESFLRSCVPDTFITFARALGNPAIDYYSAFISYSTKDADLVERLHADLRSKGVRCWFAPRDMKIGDKLIPRIDETIRIHDKLLLVLSRHSVTSLWVEQEVEMALEKEREQGRTVLLPIRLDDSLMQIRTGWPALIRNTRNIGDFCKWKDHDSYSKAFERLLRDLQAEDKA